ncbi:MAG: flavin reductase family protein [Pseudomonadota bacterium]|nr:flavin reductase family protein [Pseudomonadota bacterium]
MLDKSNKELRKSFGKFATGVAVITFTNNKNQRLGITVNSFTSLSLKPPMILWCLDKSSDLYEELLNTNTYTVNFLSEHQENIAHLLSQKNDHSLDSVEYKEGPNGLEIEGTIGWISCSKNNSIDSGDHSILVANVLDCHVNEGKPLIFWGSNYQKLK